jgi:type IX secretion system PorP/SprF family membrane protein
MKKFLIITFVAVSFMASAQQDPQHTMYRFNGLMFNPAYAGSREALSMVAIARWQWINVDGAPRTVSFAIHSPLKNDHIALGFSFVSDHYTVVHSDKLEGDFAYRITASKKKNIKISLGLGVSATNLRADLTSVGLQTGSGIDHSFANNINLWMPNITAGAYVYNEKFFVGISVPEILSNSLTTKNEVWQRSIDSAHQYTSLYATAGYVFDLGKKVKFAPSILIKYVPKYAPISMDFNANFIFIDRLWLGVSYRLSDSYGFMVAFNITKQLRVGYAYDLTVSPISHFTTGSHEIMAGYDFDFRKKSIINPRYVRYF